MILYLSVVEPNEKATHVKVSVTHRNKRVMLDVNPVVISDGFILQAYDLTSDRRSRFPLCDMPRLAPKQFKLRCEGVKDVVVNRKTDDFVWEMIRAASSEAGVVVPEVGVMNWEEG